MFILYSSLFFILPFSPSSHKYDIGHVKFSLHSLHYIRTNFPIHITKEASNIFTSIVEHSCVSSYGAKYCSSKAIEW
jgi:hypothetical protein